MASVNTPKWVVTVSYKDGSPPTVRRFQSEQDALTFRSKELKKNNVSTATVRKVK